MLERAHHVAHESLGVHVAHPIVRVALDDEIAHRLHQVGLAQPDAAVDEQGIVGDAGILTDLGRRGLRELVALAFHEAVEGEFRIDAIAGGRRQRGAVDGGRRRRGGRLQGADDELHRRRLRQVVGDRQVFEHPLHPGQTVFGQPVDNVLIGRVKPHAAATLVDLEGPHPHVELLFGQLALQLLETAMP